MKDEFTISSFDELQRIIAESFITSTQTENSSPHYSTVLFRGQANASWWLVSTLERYRSGRPFRIVEYVRALYSAMPEFNSYRDASHLRGTSPNNIISVHDLTNSLDVLESMARLRHFGFPSPLLDWTRSVYIAAYFACSSRLGEDGAIYGYQEYIGNGKVGWAGEPRITSIGASITTSERHHIQQCEYTVCTNPADEGRFPDHDEFSSHEDVFARDDPHQDRLAKFIIPSSMKKAIVDQLHEMNINSYTLFRNEEGLCDMLAYKYLT